MGHDDGLGKYPVVIALGDTLTREQTNEVMLRTNRWYLGCNDEAWVDIVTYILGHADQLNDNLVELPDGDRIWDWQLRHELADAFGDSIDALKLFALDNESIMTSCTNGPCGWLDWSGRIRAHYTEGSKWTSIEEVEADWTDIAAAFPFLRLRTQLAAGTYLNKLPPGTVGAEWVIENGTVTRVEDPGPPLVKAPSTWRRPLSEWWEFDWWHWKIAKPFTRLYYWTVRHRTPRWPVIGPWRPEMEWRERCVSAARLIEAVDQLKTSTSERNPIE